MKAFTLLSLLFTTTAFANIDCNNPVNIREILTCNHLQQAGRTGLAPQSNCLDGHCDDTTTRSVANSGSRMPGLTRLFFAQDANCTNFINNDGSYGAWGNVVKDYITNSPASARFLGDNVAHINQSCPRWGRLNREQRTHFWVWSFAAIAWDESRCRANARNARATNGVAVGLLQMEENRSARSWRGPNCRVSSVSGAAENLRCGLDIMAELLRGQQGEYRGRGALVYTGGRNTSYWEKLRHSGGGTIGDRIRSHPLCN